MLAQYRTVLYLSFEGPSRSLLHGDPHGKAQGLDLFAADTAVRVLPGLLLFVPHVTHQQ